MPEYIIKMDVYRNPRCKIPEFVGYVNLGKNNSKRKMVPYANLVVTHTNSNYEHAFIDKVLEETGETSIDTSKLVIRKLMRLNINLLRELGVNPVKVVFRIIELGKQPALKAIRLTELLVHPHSVELISDKLLV